MRLSTSRVSVALGQPAAPIISDVSLTVAPGEIVAIVAPSGAGKTTLLHFLGGLLPSEAEIKFERFSYGDLDYSDFCEFTPVGFVFQRNLFFEWLSVGDGIAQYLDASGSRADRAVIQDMFDRLGILNSVEKRPSEMSGGMITRAAMIRALLVNTQLILLDEPFSGLDELARMKCLKLLRENITEGRKLCVLVSHDIHDISMVANRVLVCTEQPLCVAVDIVIGTTGRLRDYEDASKVAREVRRCVLDAWNSCEAYHQC